MSILLNVVIVICGLYLAYQLFLFTMAVVLVLTTLKKTREELVPFLFKLEKAGVDNKSIKILIDIYCKYHNISKIK